MTDPIDHDERAHSAFAPSAAARWLRCPASLQANLLVPDESSVYAEEGTRAHELAEWMLRDDRTLPPEHDPDMYEHVLRYVTWMRELAEGAEVVLTERRVDFSHLTPIPNQTGTCDFAAIIASRVGAVLKTADLKFGTGVRVEAKDNEQQLIYALALFEEYDWLFDIKRIDIHICQPRLNVFSTWEVSRADLLKLGEYVRERAALAFQPDAPRVAGEKQCRFCKVKADCPALLDALHQIADDTFEDLTALTPSRVLEVPLKPPSLPAIPTLTVEQMARLLPYRSTVEGWFKAMHERLEGLAINGETVPGWKVVEGRSRRGWRAEGDAAKALLAAGVNPYVAKMCSPSEAETLLKGAGVKAKEAKAAVAPLVVKPPGRPTLVRDGDDRDVLGETDIEGVFEEVD